MCEINIIIELVKTMNIGIALTGITALAALLTSIASLRSIKELKKQRESSLLPKLVINSMFYDLYFPGNKIESKNILKLDLFNCGNGSAVNVSIDWDVDLDNIIRAVNFFKNAKYNLSKESKKVLTINMGNIYSLHEISKQAKHFINLIGKQKIEKVMVPYFIVDSLIVYQVCIMKYGEHKNIGEINVPEFPIISMTVCYQDIEERKYTQKYDISFSTHLMKEVSKDGFSFVGEVSVKSI